MREEKNGKKMGQESDSSAQFGKLADLSTLVNDGLFIFDPDSNCFKYMTQMVPEVLGRTKSELADCTDLISLFHEKDREMISGAISRVLSQEENFSSDLVVRAIIPGKEYRWTRLKVHRITSPVKGGNFIGGSLSDIQTLRDAQMEAQFYLDIMTHDITNKHQVMLMNLEMLRYSGNLPPEKLGYLTSCVKQLGRAMDTIRSVKIMADVGIGPVETEPVDLGRCIRKGMEALENYHPYLRSRVDLRLPEEPMMVLADDRLTLIVYHLLSNSITHNHSDHPLVTIEIKERTDGTDLVISDNGPGISSETIEEIKKLGPREVTKAQGRGLGLSLISVLVKAYEGKFELRSGSDAPEGMGTTAIVNLKRSSSMN
jgi:signal transduction histidine kinase